MNLSHTNQARGVEDAALNLSHTNQARGVEDAALNLSHTNQARGVEDAAPYKRIDTTSFPRYNSRRKRGAF